MIELFREARDLQGSRASPGIIERLAPLAETKGDRAILQTVKALRAEFAS